MSRVPPEWYPDPYQPGLLRWWNGDTWTEHAQWAPAFPQARHDVQADLRWEQRAARRAVGAVWVSVPLYVAQYLLAVSTTHRFFTALRDFVNSDGATGNTDSNFVLPAQVRSHLLAAELLDVGVGVAQILFMIWLFRVATVAARAGLPARHSPAWAVFGFLIPVINLWFPYQMVCDLLPANHPHRHLVKRWWFTWLSVSLGSPVFLVAGAFSEPLGYVFAAPVIALMCWTAILFRRVIIAVTETHADMLGR